MRIRLDNSEKNLVLNQQETFKTDLGWAESFEVFERSILEDIINPIENYETNRYIHKPYTSPNNIEQTDIWFYFNFVKNGAYVNGYDYGAVGLVQSNKLLSDLKNSFFRLEFYKTPNGESPNRENRRLVFAKNLSPVVGERVTLSTDNQTYYVPVFVGSSVKNKENMYLFWFHDDTVLEESLLTGGTFYMSAKFYNAYDGSKLLFANKPIQNSASVVEENDVYYRVEFYKDENGSPTYHYIVYEYNGSIGNRIGLSGNPIMFYQMV